MMLENMKTYISRMVLQLQSRPFSILVPLLLTGLNYVHFLSLPVLGALGGIANSPSSSMVASAIGKFFDYSLTPKIQKEMLANDN